MKRLAAMGAYRLSYYLKCHDGESVLEQYKGLLSTDVSMEEYLVLEENYVESLLTEMNSLRAVFRIITGVTENDDDPGPDEMINKIEDSSAVNSIWNRRESLIAWVAFEFSVLLYMSEEVGRLYEVIYPKGKGKACVGLAAKILFGDDYCLQNPQCLQAAFDAIQGLFLVRKPTVNRITEALVMDDGLLDFLGGKDDALMDDPFVSVYRYQPIGCQEDIFRMDLVNQVSKALETYSRKGTENQSLIVTVIGEEMSGRKYLLKRIADEREQDILMVPAHALGDMEHLLCNLQKFLREVLLSNLVLCIVDVETNEHTLAMLQIVLHEYEKIVKRGFRMGVGNKATDKPLMISGDVKMKLSPHFDRLVCQVECAVPNMMQAMVAWDSYAMRYLGDKVLNSRELAVKMKLPYGKMEQIVKKLQYAPVQNPYDSKYVFRCCYELLDDGRYDNIKRVEARYSIDDLKLEESQKQIIQDICNQVEYRRIVMDDWNLKSKYSYGTCVSALFTGPPGTGKTMAVHVMAGILGLELYKVDVSQLVDKYIGETEKRLEEVFQRAEKSNMILFFDEADAIIGKRSEVKEANDKYANTEVAYLLQRIEEYDGIVILASNYSQNIDPAIMRRIRYTVHFSLPNEETRQEIWKSAFAPEVPLGKIDFEYLARQFEFSGGQIKNIVLNAVFLAAAEESRVSMEHIIRAISLDLVKDKQVSFSRAEFGEYAYLV